MPNRPSINSCRECGFPYDPNTSSHCPKCNSGFDDFGYIEILEIDVVHSGESWQEAKFKIEQGLDKAIFHKHKGLKVIHGYGSRGGSSVIAPQAIAFMRHLADLHDGRFAKDHQNPGVSIIWLNRKPRQTSTKPSTIHLSHSPPLPSHTNWFEQAMNQAQKKKD